MQFKRDVTGLTRSHVSARLWRSWPVLTFVPRHLRTFPYSPYLYPYLAHEDSSSLSNVFVSTTHSYVYVAFSITTSFSALYPGSCLLRDTRPECDLNANLTNHYANMSAI